MSKICAKYQYASRAVCAYAHIFQNSPGCALIGACALIKNIAKSEQSSHTPGNRHQRSYHFEVKKKISLDGKKNG